VTAAAASPRAVMASNTATWARASPPASSAAAALPG
jgi:hypothetical protein